MKRLGIERQKVFEYFKGLPQRTYDLWHDFGTKIGDPVPWDDGAMAVERWALEHHRQAQRARWLQEAKERELEALDTGPKDESGMEQLDLPGMTGDDMLAHVDNVIQDIVTKIEKLRKNPHADIQTLIARGKEYVVLLDKREMLSQRLRAKDDGLVPRELVIAAIDAIHQKMPDRIEERLLAAKAEANDALRNGTWSEFCERFRFNTLDAVARESIGTHMDSV